MTLMVSVSLWLKTTTTLRFKKNVKWQQNSRTKWRNFDSVRYKNCSGGLICPNYQCPYREKFSLANQINFEKNRLCSLCGATGEKVECFARKYIAMKGKSAYVYHYGQHQCRAKLVQQRQTDIIAQAMKSNPTIKPSAVQSQTVLTALRSRKPLDQVFNTANKVTDCTKISNEKIKQTKLQQLNGTSFEGIREYKKYIDSSDKLLVAEINDSEQYVFKESLEKSEDCK